MRTCSIAYYPSMRRFVAVGPGVGVGRYGSGDGIYLAIRIHNVPWEFSIVDVCSVLMAHEFIPLTDCQSYNVEWRSEWGDTLREAYV